MTPPEPIFDGFNRFLTLYVPQIRDFGSKGGQKGSPGQKPPKPPFVEGGQGYPKTTLGAPTRRGTRVMAAQSFNFT